MEKQNTWYVLSATNCLLLIVGQVFLQKNQKILRTVMCNRHISK